MNTFEIYYEEADGDDEKKYIGTLNANTMGEALEKAAKMWNYETHDLVAKQINLYV